MVGMVFVELILLTPVTLGIPVMAKGYPKQDRVFITLLYADSISTLV